MSGCKWMRLGPPEMRCILDAHDESIEHKWVATLRGQVQLRERAVLDAAEKWRDGDTEDDNELMNAVDAWLACRAEVGDGA